MVASDALKIGFVLVFLAYFVQLYKTYKTKRGDGIALNGYLVTFITLSGYIFWSKGTIGFVKVLELLIHTLTFAYIFGKSKRIGFSKKNSGVFLVALLGSINLIGGIAQAYKSYQNIAPSDVSFMHYLLIFTANFFFLYVAFVEQERFAIFFGLIMTNIIYLYILFKTARSITK